LAEEDGIAVQSFRTGSSKQHTSTIGSIVHELNSSLIISVLSGVEKVTAEAGAMIIIAPS